jgi:hypothetical protein
MTGRAVDTTRLSNDAMNSAMPVMTTAHTARDLVRLPSSVAAPPVGPSPAPAAGGTDSALDPASGATLGATLGAALGAGSAVAWAVCSVPTSVPGRPERCQRPVHDLVEAVRHLLTCE